jgi:exodeoxyribonuclease I
LISTQRAPAATLLWHDYETFGTSPEHDFPAQFAAIRTDHALAVVGAPISCYCQPPPDYLPHPIACLITGITPQLCQRQGLSEREFAHRIHFEMAAANTTTIGYNSMRFDEEFTRQLLWRNFFPAYEREYKNGNSRFDLIDVMRMAYALRPEGLHWPSVEGKPSFKLELLAQANALEHTQAHDALSDVQVLIALARRLREAQPKLWDYAFSLRHKITVQALIDYSNSLPLVHVSQRFAAERGCLALWLPICAHPSRANEIIGIDLATSVQDLLTLDSDEIAERIFVKQSDLPEGESRIAVKTLHLNRAPMLAPLTVLKSSDLARIGLGNNADAPLEAQLARAQQLRACADLANKLRRVFASQQHIARPTVGIDHALYAGMLPDADATLLRRVRESEPSAFAALSEKFRDPRLAELLWRYQARQFPDSLNPAQRLRWQQHIENQLENAAPMTRTHFAMELEAARSSPMAHGKQSILDALQAYLLAGSS